MEAIYIQANQTGNPDVLLATTEELGDPKAGEVLIRQHAAGVNFIDVMARSGELPGALPLRFGLEAAGEVVSVGGGVEHLSPGDRVVYAGGPAGAYASARLVPADRIVKLPAELSYSDAAAIFFKALTADYLVHRLRDLEPGQTVLFHAAAGGVASLAIPMLKHRGVQVIGAVGSTEKRDTAIGYGCGAVFVLGDDTSDLPAFVRELTDGVGATVAYDSIGKATMDASLKSLARFGLLVSYGWASGEADPIPFSVMREQGSVFITRPTVSHYTENRADLEAAAARVFQLVRDGVIRASISARFDLGDAAQAHRLLESRKSTGSIILDTQRS